MGLVSQGYSVIMGDFKTLKSLASPSPRFFSSFMLGTTMSTITDEYMREHLQTAKPYTIVILHRTPKYKTTQTADKVIWEHVRRNFQLRQEGKLNVVCPIMDETDVAGVSIFFSDPAETVRTMQEDPAVMAGILRFETHTARSFPGDSLA